MGTGDVLAWRQRRMEELAKKLGGKAELGRRLGYRDGAFVGQMISGLRPITEKTINAAERIPGCAGWFTFAKPVKGAVFDALSTEERELLSHWRRLLGKDRRAKMADIAALAKEREAEKAELFEMAGVTRIAEKAAHASRAVRQGTTVEIDAKLRQRSLLDEPRDK
jgi:hypothetical protein